MMTTLKQLKPSLWVLAVMMFVQGCGSLNTSDSKNTTLNVEDAIFDPALMTRDTGVTGPGKFPATLQEISQKTDFSLSQIQEAFSIYESSGMGLPTAFKTRYGYFFGFPFSQLPTYGFNAWTAIYSPGIVIASYQVKVVKNGGKLQSCHPFVPAQYCVK